MNLECDKVPHSSLARNLNKVNSKLFIKPRMQQDTGATVSNTASNNVNQALHTHTHTHTAFKKYGFPGKQKDKGICHR